MKKWHWGIVAVAASLPLALAVWFAARYSVDVLYWDQWSLVPTMAEFYATGSIP